MIENNETDLEFSIRLLGVDFEAADNIKNQYKILSPELGFYFKDKSLSVVTFPVFEGLNMDLVNSLLCEYERSFVEADFFISISSNVETQIINIPEYVVSAMRTCVVSVKISYTVFSDIE